MTTSQEYFLKWQFPDVKFPKRQVLKCVLGGALGPQPVLATALGPQPILATELGPYPANKASPPDLAIRRRKCDGGGYIVPL